MKLFKKRKHKNLLFNNILSVRDKIIQEVITSNRDKTRLPSKKLKNSGQLLDKYTRKLISI